MNKLTVGIVRVSTVLQNPQLQITRIEQEAKAHGLRVFTYEDWREVHRVITDPVCVIVEDRASGKNVHGRKGMTWALGEVQGGRVKEVWVWRTDRIGRSAVDNWRFAAACLDRDTTLRGFSDNITLDTKEGRLHYTMLSAMAEYQREIMRENTIAGLQERVNTCKKCGQHKDKHGTNMACVFEPTPHTGSRKYRTSDHVWSLLPKLWELADLGFSHRHMAMVLGLNGRTIRMYLKRRPELEPGWKKRR